MGEKPYLRSVKQVDTNPSRPTFQPPLMTGLSEQGVSLSQPLPPHTRRSLSGLMGSARAFVAPRIRQAAPLVALLRDEEEAGYFYSDLAQLLSEDGVLFFPSAYRRAIRYGHRDESSALLRSMVLSALISAAAPGGTPLPILVTYPEALMEGIPQESGTKEEPLIIHRGDVIERDHLRDQLLAWGFERVDYVYEPGQFALRGSIVDIYSFASELPYRLDFFDDEVESVRCFEVDSQLSVRQLTEITLSPDLSQGSGDLTSLISLLPAGTQLLLSGGGSLSTRLEMTWTEAPLLQDGEGFEDLEALRRMLIEPSQLFSEIQALSGYELTDEATPNGLHFHTTRQPLFHKDYDGLAAQIRSWRTDGYTIYICAASREGHERARDILTPRLSEAELPTEVTLGLHEGFVDEDHRWVLLTEHELFDRYHKYTLRSDKASSGKVTLSLKEIQSFSRGDLIVHADHGIGRFDGLVSMPQGDHMQEFVKLVYRNNDTIYVNLHSLHKLSHYRSGEGGKEVTLSAVGSGAWQRIKERTKKRIKDIARDLIRLYAKRRETEGFAFSPDTYLQHELEASFAFEDTPDQAAAVTAVKADMERPYPMDRLLCGDVGFGKTEVAVRAAFKAATDGKQVAVLVPTTVLAYQHYRTFSKRLKDFPVRVDYISRARTPKELRAILADLREGKIDIIIGTHRLTSKDVAFHDLGLLIIDEEQKFGVATKEKLRQLQVNVDTLTMSATPIPRTLQFSLMGARDLSNLNTPPANRRPVETLLTQTTPQIIREAVGFEMSRNGQVYFVNSRISNIENLAALIQREVPDARIAVAHGQLAPKEMEQILIDFGNHEYDVLVATKIIENGIDVPNANTIMIHDAHHYGLSELHQLRGRVGRSDRKAFCYLLTPPLEGLSEDSKRRLRAIESFSDLGSGIRIALQDLDQRGAGNVLGAEQSGFITDMGYETYQKVFSEAIRELKADEFAHVYADDDKQSDGSELADRFVVETQVESDLELALPDEYVPSDSERILLYRELDSLSEDKELEDFASRLRDRFGALPPETEELILIPRLRRLGHHLGIEKVVLKGGSMSLHLIADTSSPYYASETFGRLLEYVARNSRQCEFVQRSGRHIIRVHHIPSVAAAITVMQHILQRRIEGTRA